MTELPLRGEAEAENFFIAETFCVNEADGFAFSLRRRCRTATDEVIEQAIY